MPLDVADGLIKQVLGEVVATCEGSGCFDVAVVAHQFGGVMIRFGIEKSVKAIESATQRPAVKRPGGPGFGKGGDMPFADHIVAIAGVSQRFCQRWRVLRYLAPIARIAAVKISQATDANGVVIAPCEQSCACC